jgi:hypothetical protein
VWRTNQALKTYQALNPANPGSFPINTNPYNLPTNSTAWAPGIVFGTTNGIAPYMTVTPLGLTIAGSGLPIYLCAGISSGSGQVPSTQPVASNCPLSVLINGVTEVSNAFWINTSNAMVLATGFANSVTNVGSNFFGWQTSAWRTDIAALGAYAHGFKTVPVSPTPSGQNPTLYLTLFDNSGIGNNFALDLRNANLPNQLGNANAAAFTSTTATAGQTTTTGVQGLGISTWASASAIAPITPVAHVTGTAAIANIVAPAGCTTTGIGCQVTLIPDGLFTTTMGGNIALASVAVLNRALIMTYDPATTKWYPSY